MGERFEWVEIIEPSRHEHMFANLKTGQCLWDPPPGVVVKPTHANQWWELFDTKTRRYYYYNATSQETVWYKPKDGDIIPLSKLQMLKSREALCNAPAVPRKVRSEKKSDNNNTDHNRRIGSVVGQQEPVKLRDRSMGTTNSREKRDIQRDDNKFVKIQDTEVISSSTNTRRSSNNRTMTLSSSIDYPTIKEKPKFSSLRQKAPPKPPRCSINIFDKNTNNSLSISSEKAADKTEAAVEDERLSSSASQSNVTRSPTNKIKVIEKPKGPAPPAPVHSSTSTSFRDSSMPITTQNSVCENQSEREQSSVSMSIEKSEYAVPSDTISAHDLPASFSQNEGKATMPSKPQAPEYASVVKVANSTVISETVELGCPIMAPGQTCNEYDTPSIENSNDTVMKLDTSCNEVMMIDDQNDSEKVDNTPLCSSVYKSDAISLGHNNNDTTCVTNTGTVNSDCDNKDINNTLAGIYAEPVVARPTHVASETSIYQNIENKILSGTKHKSLSNELITEMEESIDDDDASVDMSRRSLEFPVNVVPVAPPPPKIASRKLLPSMYDNVSPGPLSMYDNSFENDELDDTLNSGDVSMSPCGNNISGSSDETFDPSANNSLVNDYPDGKYYNRLSNDTDRRSATLPSPKVSPRKMHISPTADNVSPPPKQTPTLVRMKSDPIVDVEKREKVSKTGSIQSTFRPISMQNLSNIAKKHSKRGVSVSESDIPERPHEVPLSTHRTGLLRRRMSIHSMLSWSKSCIKKPMVLTRDKTLRKDAVDVFKLILIYMGDKSTMRKHDDICVDIVTKGWSTPALRDEIYIQLCKQTTGNKKITSLKQGWELITACLSIFPPSNKFHSYLEGYISRHIDSEDENVIQANGPSYAKYCHKQLERICQMGAKRGLKGPTIEEIQSAIKRVFNPSMFGNTLEDVMEMQKERFPELMLPWILTTLTESVLRCNGLQTEGIFRVPGDIDDVNQLKLMVDNWQHPEQTADPTVPASLLKLWFRDLYEPLIPQRFYDQCIHNCDDPEIILNIVHSLPSLNYLVFSYLIRLLQAFVIAENVAMSKMDENNLAMVWAPNCLRCPSDNPCEIFENTRKEMTFLRTVLKVLDTSFLEGVL